MKLRHVLTIALVFTFAARGAQGELSVHLPMPEQLAGGTLPQFSARDHSGDRLFQRRQLQNLIGPETKRIALVYFTTWCLPCAKGAVTLKNAINELRQNGVQAVFVNAGERDAEKVQEWVSTYGGADFPLVMDTRLQMVGPFGLLEANGTLITPKILVLNETLTPLFLLGAEGDDFPEILWRHNP